jgi:hypothetical protein
MFFIRMTNRMINSVMLFIYIVMNNEAHQGLKWALFLITWWATRGGLPVVGYPWWLPVVATRGGYPWWLPVVATRGAHQGLKG